MDKNTERLFIILNENADTEFGRDHGFADIKSVEDYRKRVPVSSYEDYAEGIKRTLAGEKGVIFSKDYDIMSCCQTSGTTGFAGKIFPITKRQMDVYGNDHDHYGDTVIAKVGGKRLFQQTCHTRPGEKDEFVLKSELFYKYKAEHGNLDYDTFVGGKTLLFDPDTEDVFFARSYAALACEDITIMDAVFHFDHLRFFTFIEKNHEEIISAMEARTIPDNIKLSPEMREMLLSLEISDERIAYIKNEMAKGFDGIAKRLWPKLVLLTGIGSRNLSAENDMLKKYAPDVSQSFNFYISTECFVGECIAENDYSIVFVPGRDYVEFRSYDTDEEEYFLPQELKVGELYEPLITNFCGLYRYRMGDLIKVIGFQGEYPLFEVLGRINMSISVAGERTLLSQVEKVAERFREDGIVFSMYCFGHSVTTKSANYRLVISGLESDISEDELIRRTDTYLMEENPQYKELRRMELIDIPEVKVVPADKYFTFLENNSILKGNKKPVHMTVKGFSAWDKYSK